MPPGGAGTNRGARFWVLAAFLVTFLAGAAVDHGVQVWRRSRGSRMIGGRAGVPRPDLMIAALTRQLNLSAAQQDSARAVFARHRCDLRDIWRVAHPRFDSLRARVDSELTAFLNPDQRAAFQKFSGKHEHHPPFPSDSGGCSGGTGL